MSEKRKIQRFNLDEGRIWEAIEGLSPYKTTYTLEEVCEKLNEQESTITSLKERNKQLRRRLEKINGGYGHLTHRKGLTANEWVIERQEKELKEKNEQISDWIERHSKDILKIGEQQATINKVYELLEEADIFSDEATEHDINAYIELRKFDNKDAYYLACGIKKAIKLLKGDDV